MIMSYSIDATPGDFVSIDDTPYSSWARVIEVHTSGLTVRHTGGEVKTYGFSRVLDHELQQRR